MTSTKIALSDGEWKLMQKLWLRSPQTITSLTAELKTETSWSKHTIITMLARLETKGAVRYETGGRARQYYPTVTHSDAAVGETESFLQKIYGGSVGLMLSYLIKTGSVSSGDIDELHGILNKLEEGDSDA